VKELEEKVASKFHRERKVEELCEERGIYILGCQCCFCPASKVAFARGRKEKKKKKKKRPHPSKRAKIGDL
jgi:hypothetical protein